MHRQRLMAIVGVIVAVIGLFLKAVTSGGESLMEGLAAAVPGFPDNLPTIWGGLDTWAQVVLVLIIIYVLAMALRGDRSTMMDRTAGMGVGVAGAALLIYAVVKWTDAADKAETLTGSFSDLAAAGAVPEAYTASANALGFGLLVIGTLLVALAGFMSMKSEV